MALQEVTYAFLKRIQTSRTPLNHVWTLQCRRYATGEAAAAIEEIEELEHSSFDNAPQPSERTSQFDPAAQARKRSKQLPPSRYTSLPTDHPNPSIQPNKLTKDM
jgi:large subunit ribosomal protein L5